MSRIPTADLFICPDERTTLRDMVVAAKQRQLCSIALTPRSDAEYREICSLRQEFGNSLDILCAEVCQTPMLTTPYALDFIIGEVQTLETESGDVIALPKSVEELRYVLHAFDFDVYRFLRRYFKAASSLPTTSQCDAVRLLNADTMWGGLFDKNDYRFRKYALDAVDSLLEQNAVFEVRTAHDHQNGGPIVFPSVMLLRRIGEKRGRVALSSGAASAERLCESFREAVVLLRACGIGNICIRKSDGWVQNSI